MKGFAKHLMMASALLLITVLMAACGHKDIDCPCEGTEINVRFEWDNAHNAAVDGMTLFFYPLDGMNRIWRFDIAGRDGGRVMLPAGEYMMTACNNDLRGVSLADTDSPTSIRAKVDRKVADGMYASTGMLYSCVVGELEVTPCGVRYLTHDGSVKDCGQKLVRCRPDSLSTHYTIMLKDVKGLKNVRNVAVAFGEVSQSIYLVSGTACDDGILSYMMMSIDGQKQCLTATGCAFDMSREYISVNKLEIFVTRSDGKSFRKKIDLQPSDLNTLSPHNVIIEVEGFEIPDNEDQSSGDVGGIAADVDGWDVVEIDLSPVL